MSETTKCAVCGSTERDPVHHYEVSWAKYHPFAPAPSPAGRDDAVSETVIERVVVELSNGLTMTMYPRVNQVDAVMRWPNGTIRGVEHCTLDQIVEELSALRAVPTPERETPA